MVKHKLVPVEPTQEMINAALKSDHAEISPRKIVEQDYKAMIAAAPAVQGEPVAWSGWGCQYPGKMPRLYGDRRIAELNCDWENGDQLLHFTAAPQPAEQQPRLAKYQPCGCVVCTCEHETQCQGCGARHCGTHPVGQILNPAYQQVDRLALTKIHASRNAADLHARNRLLADALEQILGWRELRSGREFPIERIEDIALAALATYRKGGDK